MGWRNAATLQLPDAALRDHKTAMAFQADAGQTT